MMYFFGFELILKKSNLFLAMQVCLGTPVPSPIAAYLQCEGHSCLLLQNWPHADCILDDFQINFEGGFFHHHQAQQKLMDVLCVVFCVCFFYLLLSMEMGRKISPKQHLVGILILMTGPFLGK